jgi:ribonuclease-3
MVGPDPNPLQPLLDIQFDDDSLLRRAFVHRSYLNELADDQVALADNERLEFLGDVVVSYIVSEQLFHLFPELLEGDLTNMRASLVRRETLARKAVELNLGTYLLLGHGEEESGGRTRPATLCATFEALVGAIYLDQGIDVCRRVLLHLFTAEFQQLQQQTETKDAKSRLQEWSQATLGFTPRYKVVDTLGPDHARHFVMLGLINGVAHGVGEGRSKQEATQRAAAMALHRAGLAAPEYEPNEPLEQAYGFH